MFREHLCRKPANFVRIKDQEDQEVPALVVCPLGRPPQLQLQHLLPLQHQHQHQLPPQHPHLLRAEDRLVVPAIEAATIRGVDAFALPIAMDLVAILKMASAVPLDAAQSSACLRLCQVERLHLHPLPLL